jgi:plasmid rolling circle replication initiator protein Rep
MCNLRAKKMSPQSVSLQDLAGQLRSLTGDFVTHRGRLERTAQRIDLVCLFIRLRVEFLSRRAFDGDRVSYEKQWEGIRRLERMYKEVVFRVLEDELLERGQVYLSDVSPEDKPWDTHRANADTVGQMYADVGEDKYSQRLQECSRTLTFAMTEGKDSDRLFRLVAARFCRVRHCPVCQWRRSKMWLARFLKAMPGVLETYQNHRFIFLTLTVRNCDVKDLRETLARMNKAWVLLTKRKQFPAIGWVKSVEVTRSKDGSAHPHFHAILMVKPSYFKSRYYLSHQAWLELWKSCLKVDYDPSIRVKAIKEDNLEKALCETLKYSVKESDLVADANWLQTLTEQLHKTRAVSIGGVLKDFLSEEEPEDLINADLEEEETLEDAPRFAFGWREVVKRYQSK